MSSLNMLIWKRGEWRQFAIMDENAAHNSLSAARREGSRVIAIGPDGIPWGWSQDRDAAKVDTPLDGVSALLTHVVPRGYRFQFGWNGYKFYGHHSDSTKPLYAIREDQ